MKGGKHMKIVGMCITPITLEWKKTIGESFGEVGKREDDVVLQVFTDDGLYGLGEAQTLGPFYGRESQGTVMSLIAEHFWPKVLRDEDPFNIDLIHSKMDRTVSENSFAKTAVDIAVHDIVGKALGVPVSRFIGGAYTDRVALHWPIGIDSPKEIAEDTEKGMKAGFKAIKMKIGSDAKRAIELVRIVRETAGPEVVLVVDANQAYDIKTAIKVIRAIEQYDIQRVEQPVHYRDLDGMALVRRSVEIPIGACESAVTPQDVVQIIKKEAADFLNFKVMRSGGFYTSKAIVQMATAAGIFCASSTMLGMGIELATDAHFAVSTVALAPSPYKYHGMATGILKLFNAVDSAGITRDIVDGTPKIENGFMSVPTAPGLGITLNKKNLEFYQTKGKQQIVLGKTF
jgi:L-alanine-DL-glutamate epimerase-like enolase superfamily enzyme